MKQIFPTFVILVVTFVLMFTLIPYAFSEVIKWVSENKIIVSPKLNFSRQNELVCGEKISPDKWTMWLWWRNGGETRNRRLKLEARSAHPSPNGQQENYPAQKMILYHFVLDNPWPFQKGRNQSGWSFRKVAAYNQERYLKQASYPISVPPTVFQC